MSLLSFKALGALLLYPEQPLIDAAADISAVLEAEGAIPPPQRQRLRTLLDHLTSGELLDRQEEYGLLFDRGRSLSLHLYEHVHGESRDRGMAMVALGELYQRNGFEISVNELPDFLPLLCEFLSQIDPVLARSILADAAPVLATLHQRLNERASLYAAVLASLIALSGVTAELGLAATPEHETADEAQAAREAACRAEGIDLEALDREWEEAAVSFGPGDALSGTAGGGSGGPGCGMPIPPPRRGLATGSAAASVVAR
ncbi:nitrate reductase molybdenum cofactor assembly chaperone NarJ/NarW [uncultured Gammaproteobacteria bacterium]